LEDTMTTDPRIQNKNQGRWCFGKTPMQKPSALDNRG